MAGDQKMFLATTHAIIAEARSRHHDLLAERLEAALQSSSQQLRALSGTTVPDTIAIDQSFPALRREDLIFPDQVWNSYDELLQENQRRDLLRSYGLEPRHRILISGAPGTGKTSLAYLLATELMLPMLHVNYASLFGSLLGETSQQLKSVLDFASGRSCVLLLDEFDSLGKSRDDPYDIGEVKRVLNYLLVKLEALPSHVVVIGATNRPDALDEAVWRRFQKVIDLPPVTSATLEQWIRRANERSIEPLGLPLAKLKESLTDLTFAELENVFQDIQRQFVLNTPNIPMKNIVVQRIKRASSRRRRRTSPRLVARRRERT